MTMTYDQDVNRAGEIARLVLPQMTRLGIPVTPVNYALWYEYHLGRSPELVAALQAIDAGTAAYDEEQAHRLYLRYVATPGVERLEQIETEVCRLLADIVQIVADAGLDITRYGALLKSCTTRLESADDIRDIRKVVETLASDTRVMAESSDNVAGMLKAHASEIDQLRAELDQVRREAVRDPLTGLANRRAFGERLAESLDETLTAMKSICLLMVDIDHFKDINDRHGHQIGDKVLQYVAGLLKRNIKGRDLVARFGGDEFSVILENAAPGGVRAVAESIRQAMDESTLRRTDTGESLGRITVSIGYECARRPDTATALLERADKARYRAKQGGRNRVSGCDEAD